MSLSNPIATNPATRFFQWHGGAEAVKEGGKTHYDGGNLSYFDKSLGDKGENVEVALPFSFIVLDELNTITGFSEKDQSGFWSNEVRSLRDEKLIVKTKSGTIAKGTYDSIKDTIKSKGAKYAKSVYVAFKDENKELQIGNIKIAGAALTAWIEFNKRFDITQCAVFITEKPKLDIKGTNHYFTPVFEGQNMNDSTKSEATKLDIELQKYLKTYFSRIPNEDDEIIVEDVDAPIESDDDPEIEETDVKIETNEHTNDKPINLAEIPF